MSFLSLLILLALSCGVLERPIRFTVRTHSPSLLGFTLMLTSSVGFGLAFAAFAQSAATAATITVTISYCIDTYPELSGEAMVTVIVIRNTMGWAITSYAYVIHDNL